MNMDQHMAYSVVTVTPAALVKFYIGCWKVVNLGYWCTLSCSPALVYAREIMEHVYAYLQRLLRFRQQSTYVKLHRAAGVTD